MNIIETNLKFNSNHQTRSGKVTGIVLHHAAANGSVETVHGWHINRGWAGIGYHFYVRKDGKVYRGRPENWIGAHTSGHNEKIGICAEGNYETETMPDVQRNAISALIAYLWDKYGSVKVYGHRDLDATACPGKNYPFDSIVDGANGNTSPAYVPTVKEWQNAAIADGYEFPEYGADGLWGDECASVARSATVKKRVTYTNKNLTRIVQKAVGFTGSDVDGLCGKNTDAAIREYQRNHGLDDDGIVGLNTWKAILNI